MFAATVFDLDDTLADSATTWGRVIRAVTGRHSYAWTSQDSASIQGTSTGHWSDYLAHRCQDVTAERAAAECVDGMVTAVEHREFGLLPGAADLLATATALGPVGLVSASPRRYVHAVVTALGLCFGTVVTGDDVVRGKPAPDPYLLAAHRLGLAAAGCLAVEDSVSGIRSARAAGMTVLAIPYATTALDSRSLDLADHHAADAHLAAKTVQTLLSAPAHAGDPVAQGVPTTTVATPVRSPRT